jgi:hypothetical protein
MSSITTKRHNLLGSTSRKAKQFKQFKMMNNKVSAMNILLLLLAVCKQGYYQSVSGQELAVGYLRTPHQTQQDERKLESNRCPVSSGTKKEFTVRPNKLLNEVSYMVTTTHKYKGRSVAWMGSDGYRRDLNAIDLETGKIIKTFYLDLPDDARGGDIESMALGPCHKSTNRQCLYVGNTGNNEAHACRDRRCTKGRSTLFIYKLKEPDIDDTPNGKALEVAIIKFDYRRSDFPTKYADSGEDICVHLCEAWLVNITLMRCPSCWKFIEALFVDPTGDKVGGTKGDLYIITKFPEKQSLQRLAIIPQSFHNKAKYGGSITSYSARYGGKLFHDDEIWTGAEMSSDGTLIAIRSYAGVYFLPRNNRSSSADSVSKILRSEPCKHYHDTKRGSKVNSQYETVDLMDRDGKLWVAEASECYRQNACKVNVTLTELEFD